MQGRFLRGKDGEHRVVREKMRAGYACVLRHGAGALMLASALILRGAISEEMANGAVLVCAAVAAFLGCMIGARKTSKRAMMTAGCAASAWVTMQAIGFFVYDGLTPERSLELAAAMAVGAVAPLLLQRNGKKGRGAKARARRKRR